MKPLVIFGVGELAELAHFYFAKRGGRSVVAFTVDAAARSRETHLDLPVVAAESLIQSHPPRTHALFIAIGTSRMNRNRAAKYAAFKALGYELATYVSPEATVHATTIGDNCLIMDHNSIHPYCRIGNDVIISNDNHIGHHSVVEDHCFISSGVVIGGGTRIGECSFLGLNATIRDHIKVGKANLIGAAAVILQDSEDGAVLTVPATKPRNMKSDLVDNV